MKKIIQNVKDPISDLIGVIIMGVTLLMVYEGKLSWQWDGTIGLGIGCFLFFVPDSIIVDSLLALFKRLMSLIGNNNG